VPYDFSRSYWRHNDGQPVYGGSDLVCVRIGWKALDALPMAAEARADVAVARLYDDEAVAVYPGFTVMLFPNGISWEGCACSFGLGAPGLEPGAR
jgi:hypothetical protein